MSYVCPKCKKPDGLWRGVDVEGWQSVGGDLKPTGERDVDWLYVEPTGEYGCGECDWRGRKDDLEQLGIDGKPLPFVHREQLELAS